MKTKNKIIILLILMILIIAISTQSYASMQIIDGATTKCSITVSNSFAYCYNLRIPGTTLGNNTLDPHLTLNSDWGAVAYLAASIYGANTTTESTITTSTTGNASGVQDFGTTYTQTSSLLSGANTSTYRTNLETFQNTIYVETLPTSNTVSTTLGQAFAETSSWAYYTSYPTSSDPIGVRKGALGSFSGSTIYGAGGSRSTATFRPAIWN